MFDSRLFAINLAFCLLSGVAATFIRAGRGEAIALSGLLAGNFVFCALAYTPYAPKYALQAAGLDVTSKDLWMLADALFGTACAFAFLRWWAWALWGLAALQVAVHITYQWVPFDPDLYSDRLQTLLHAQLAVFYLAGGPGALDYVRRIIARFGRAGGVPASALSATRTPAE